MNYFIFYNKSMKEKTMEKQIKTYADFRVSEDEELLIILDEEIFDSIQPVKLYFENNRILSTDGKLNLDILIDHPELIKDIEKCKKIHLIEKTEAGFFQIIPNIKLIRKNR